MKTYFRILLLSIHISNSKATTTATAIATAMHSISNSISISIPEEMEGAALVSDHQSVLVMDG